MVNCWPNPAFYGHNHGSWLLVNFASFIMAVGYKSIMVSWVWLNQLRSQVWCGDVAAWDLAERSANWCPDMSWRTSAKCQRRGKLCSTPPVWVGIWAKKQRQWGGLGKPWNLLKPLLDLLMFERGFKMVWHPAKSEIERVTLQSAHHPIVRSSGHWGQVQVPTRCCNSLGCTDRLIDFTWIQGHLV